MTTMPPEMSTAATPTVTLPSSGAGLPRDSLSALSQSSRSRFMITDILAGSAAAAAAAMQNGANMHNNNNNNSHHHNSNGSGSPPQGHAQQHQQQQHAALQHYLAQQQHLLQQQQQLHMSAAAAHHPHQQQHQHQHQLQHQHQQQQQHQQPHHPHAHHLRGPQSPSPPFPPHHPLAHLPPGALMAFPPGSTPNGLHAAQAAAHYAALQQERERLRELDTAAAVAAATGAAASMLDHDERSRSPHQVRDLSGMQSGNASAAGATGGGGGGGGGGSSISGDQASTIGDSDSDTCGAKDDDGNSSIKSDNLMGLSKKQRKARTAFTDHQLQTLEKSFERQKYLSVQDRMELANKLELSDCQVKTWYQNRRTKWKRQTAVGLELLAEAGNYAAFQRLYGSSPYLSAWPYAAQAPHGSPSSAIDLYYRQAAAAAALQKPLSYRMYPSMPSMGGLPGMPVAPSPMSHLSASNSLSTLGSYYQASGAGVPPSAHSLPPLHAHSPVQSELSDKRRNSVELTRTPSPQLNPGSPPERAENNSSCPPPSDDDADEEEDAIEV